MFYQKSENLKSYRKKAQFIHDYLNKSARYDKTHLPRPFFIEFFGMPSAGKSGAIHRLYKFLSLLGLRVKKYQEPGELIRVSHDTPTFNVRVGLRILDEMLELETRADCDVVIFERGIFDAYCWMNFWFKKGLLNKKERDCFQNFFTSRFWLKTVDIPFFLSCGHKIGIKRNAKNNMLPVSGETINSDVMAELESNYKESLKTLEKIAPNIISIKTDEMTADQVAQSVCDHAIRTLNKLSKQRRPVKDSANRSSSV